jgi:arabinose-5-phosphate isomerase
MRWKESLAQQIETLSRLLNSTELEKNVDLFIKMSHRTKGFHYFTGIGKNMFVAARVAATYDSLGIRSLYVDPVNTLHGSMGIFNASDLVIAISKSGETEELLRFISILVNRNFHNVVSITANRSSTLSKMSAVTIPVEVANEGDHLGLAPIASTMAFAAILDSIAVQISSENGYNSSNFVFNHPGGSLGKTVI